MPLKKREPTTSIHDVLRQLGSPAQDTLLGELRKLCGLGSFRRGCKAFRGFVDNSVVELNLDLAAVHKKLLAAKHGPPTLPRCRILAIKLRAVDEWKASTNEAVMKFFMRSLPPQVRERITKLTIDISYRFTGPHLAVAAVVSLLPTLRDFNLVWDCCSVSDDRQQRELVHATISALPRLESLSIPGLGALPHLAASASARGGLKHLVLHHGNDSKFSSESARALGRLEALTHMRIGHCDNDEQAVAALLLLQHLPPQLERLELPVFNLSLQSGTITALELDQFNTECWLRGAWLERLLRCGAVGARLPRLVVGTVEVVGRGVYGEPPGAMADLLRRCEVVEVGVMNLTAGVGRLEVQHTLQLLGWWPASFSFSLMYRELRPSLASLHVPWRHTPFVAQTPLRLPKGWPTPAPAPASRPNSAPRPAKPPSSTSTSSESLPEEAEVPDDPFASLTVEAILRRCAPPRQSGVPKADAAEEAEDRATEEAMKDLLSVALNDFVATICPPPSHAAPAHAGSYSYGVANFFDADDFSVLLLRGPGVARRLGCGGPGHRSSVDDWLTALQRKSGFQKWVLRHRKGRQEYDEDEQEEAVYYMTLPDQQAILMCFPEPRLASNFALAAAKTSAASA